MKKYNSAITTTESVRPTSIGQRESRKSFHTKCMYNVAVLVEQNNATFTLL